MTISEVGIREERVFHGLGGQISQPGSQEAQQSHDSSWGSLTLYDTLKPVGPEAFLGMLPARQLELPSLASHIPGC